MSGVRSGKEVWIGFAAMPSKKIQYIVVPAGGLIAAER
jgi:hypothetical protein